MGAITDDLKRQIKELTVVLNETTDASDKADIQEGIDELQKELDELTKAKEKPKKEVKPKKDKQTNSEWESEIIEIASDKLGMSNSDAQGWFDNQSFYSAQAWTKGLSANKAFEYIQEKNNKSHEKSETKKEEKSEHNGKFSSLKVGEETTDEDGNVIKHTDSDTYILHYHQGENTVVAFNKKGDKWIADCCERKGIEFSAKEINTGIEEIIKGLDCHYELEKRTASAKKRKIAREKYDKLSETEKVENTIEKTVSSVENKVEDLKKDGKGINPSKAKSFGVDIAKLVKVIDKGIKEQAERKKFIENLIKDLQKLI